MSSACRAHSKVATQSGWLRQHNCDRNLKTTATVDRVLGAGRSAQAAGGRNAIIAVVAVTVLFLLTAIAQGAVPIGSDFRVSEIGVDGDTARGAADSAVAYNSSANEYLVVWYGDGE